MPLEDMKIRSAIFAGLMITAGDGKIAASGTSLHGHKFMFLEIRPI
jgi:hypothetical protein